MIYANIKPLCFFIFLNFNYRISLFKNNLICLFQIYRPHYRVLSINDKSKLISYRPMSRSLFQWKFYCLNIEHNKEYIFFQYRLFLIENISKYLRLSPIFKKIYFILIYKLDNIFFKNIRFFYIFFNVVQRNIKNWKLFKSTL